MLSQLTELTDQRAGLNLKPFPECLVDQPKQLL